VRKRLKNETLCLQLLKKSLLIAPCFIDEMARESPTPQEFIRAMASKKEAKSTSKVAQEHATRVAFYECVFIIRQDLAKSDVDTITDSFAALLQKNGGKVVKREYWGLRPLAYEVAKNRRGHYVMLVVESTAAALAAMTYEMRISEDVIRQMEVRVDKVDSNKPSVMLQRNDESEAA
jgi:small subunit ribosomal protein S6